MEALSTGSIRTSEDGDLGRYRLCAELASGGMATVFLATTGSDVGFNKLVALKRIHAHLARDARFVDMFLDEARVASRISHPNVCSVFDFGEVDGTFFIAMEYLVGETFLSLTRKLRKSRSGNWVVNVCEIFAQASEGLHAAHELRSDDGELVGLVHRDVSPQNLFLTYAGCVKVVDFGIARCEGRIQHTEPGTIKGKMSYVAPEQVRSQEADRRADIWALGVTMWEALTGRPLFRRKNDLETLQAVLSGEIPTPSSVLPEIPAELDAVVMRALARNPDERYATARDFSRAIREFVHSQRVVVGQVELEEWMRDLFPDQEIRRQAMRDAVRGTRSSSAVRLRRANPSVIDEPLSSVLDLSQHAGGTSEKKAPRVPASFWAGMGAAALIAVAAGGWMVALVGRDAAGAPTTERPLATLTADPTSQGMPAVAAPTATGSIAAPSAQYVPATPSAPSAVTPAAPEAMATAPARDGRGRMFHPRARSNGGTSAPEAERAPAQEEAAPAEQHVAAAPAVAPAPIPAPTPAPSIARVSVETRTPAPAPAPPPAMDAQASIDAMRTAGAMPMSQIRSSVDRLLGQYADCYRTAARAAHRDAAGEVQVHFTLDEMGSARRVTANGSPLPGVGTCIERATSSLRTRQRPDTGGVDVSYAVRFVPRRPGQ